MVEGKAEQLEEIYSFSVKDQEDGVREAEEAGYEIVKGTPSLLVLDLDDEESIRHYQELVYWCADVEEVARWHSKSGTGLHVTLEVYPDKEIKERLLLQALLGSDRVKEYLSWRYVEDGGDPDLATVLFKPTEKTKKEQG